VTNFVWKVITLFYYCTSAWEFCLPACLSHSSVVINAIIHIKLLKPSVRLILYLYESNWHYRIPTETLSGDIKYRYGMKNMRFSANISQHI